MAQSYSGFICFLAWTSNIFARSQSKRAVALAFINAFSQFGNFAGSWVSCVVCYRTFTALDINFIRTGIHGKGPGVRPTPIRTRFAFRRTCSASPCALSSGRCSPKRTKIYRSASPREAEGTDIYFKKYQYKGRDHHVNRRSTQDRQPRPKAIRGRGRSDSVRRKHLSCGRDVDIDVKSHHKDDGLNRGFLYLSLPLASTR